MTEAVDLRKHGYRVTPQRARILEVFQDLPPGTHLSAEELHRQLRSAEPPISLATAYRTLKLLATLGVLREVDLAEEHRRYELNRDHPHHHLVCARCGTTVEFADAPMLRVGRQVAEAHGFELLEVQFQLLGLCPACRSAEGALL